MDHAKAELKLADGNKWAAIKKAKKAEDKAAKYAERAERKQKEAAEASKLAERKHKEAAEARKLADTYAADVKKTGSEAQAARDAFDAISKRFKELMQPTGEPAGRPGRPKNKKPK